MVRGVKALHDNKIIHRDLKVSSKIYDFQTANIFLTSDKKVKIGDMNVAKILKG